MKAKDIEAGGYYWTRATRYDPTYPVQVVEVIDVPTYSGWAAKRPTGSVKKVVVNQLNIDAAGHLVVGYDRKLMLGQLASPAKREAVVERLQAERDRKETAANNRKVADDRGAEMIAALAAAGFAGAFSDYKGIHLSRAMIAAWAEANPKA